MGYRALTAVIVAFWLVMTAMLVRVEFAPNDSNLLPVPPEHVFKQMFLHEQASDLVLCHGRDRLGVFHLQPKHLPTAPDGPANMVTFTGNFSLSLPGGPPNQRLNLHGSLDLDNRQAVRRFDFKAYLHEPKQTLPSLGFALDGLPGSNQCHYQVLRADVVQKEASGTPAQLLDDPDLRVLGFDPRPMLVNAGQQQAASTKLTARRSSIRSNGEVIETYLLTIQHAESIESTIQVSQLGQILIVKTFAGYDLYDETLTP